MLKKISRCCLVQCIKKYGQNHSTPCIDLLYELINDDYSFSDKEFDKLLSLLLTDSMLRHMNNNINLDNFKCELFKKLFSQHIPSLHQLKSIIMLYIGNGQFRINSKTKYFLLNSLKENNICSNEIYEILLNENDYIDLDILKIYEIKTFDDILSITDRQNLDYYGEFLKFIIKFSNIKFSKDNIYSLYCNHFHKESQFYHIMMNNIDFVPDFDPFIIKYSNNRSICYYDTETNRDFHKCPLKLQKNFVTINENKLNSNTLSFVCDYDHEDIYKHIITMGIRPNNNCLHYALMNTVYDNTTIIKDILDYKIEPSNDHLKTVLNSEKYNYSTNRFSSNTFSSNKTRRKFREKYIDLMIYYGLDIDKNSMIDILIHDMYVNHEFIIDEEIYFRIYTSKKINKTIDLNRLKRYKISDKINDKNRFMNIIKLRNMFDTSSQNKNTITNITKFMINNKIKPDRYCVDVSFCQGNNRLIKLLCVYLNCKPEISTMTCGLTMILENISHSSQIEKYQKNVHNITESFYKNQCITNAFMSECYDIDINKLKNLIK
jgi:hypothetical protein